MNKSLSPPPSPSGMMMQRWKKKRSNTHLPCNMMSILLLALLSLSSCYFTLATNTITPFTTKSVTTPKDTRTTAAIMRKTAAFYSSPLIVFGDDIDMSSLSSSSQVALIKLRGGSSDSDYDEDGDEMEESSAVDTVMDVLVDTSKKMIVVVGRVTLETVYAIQRAVEAGISAATSGDDDEEVSIVVKIGNIISSMWDAALHVPSDEQEQEEEEMEEVMLSSSKKRSKRSKSASTASKEDASVEIGEDTALGGSDFGSYLIKSYNIKKEARDDDDNTSKETIKGGSFNNALRYARSQARLLVVYIPSSPPNKKKKGNSYDDVAIRSLTSAVVSSVTQKRAIRTKGGGKGSSYGSFVLWGTKAGSSEAVLSTKRLKVKKTGSKESPTLVVVYPAQVIDSSGRPKLIPRVLSQHHCNPPPNSESMAAWLNALRKRHAKQYATMQHELQELQYFQERKEGYKESIVGDTNREKREKQEEMERLAKEKAEKERIEMLQKRRKTLRENLPEEPSAGDTSNVMTIALRFADGRTGKRRFNAEVELNELFNWVDGFFDIEREKVILSTMNGQRSFTFVGEDAEENDEETSEIMTLEEAGFGRMTGLRVTERKEDEEEEEE